MFLNYTPTPEIYTLSLHDALPISERIAQLRGESKRIRGHRNRSFLNRRQQRKQRRVKKNSCSCAREFVDRKSTRLNSSHGYISYAVFCLKKKKKTRRKL